MYQYQPCKIAGVLHNPSFQCREVHKWLRKFKQQPESESVDLDAREGGEEKNKHAKKKRKMHPIQLYNILRSKCMA